MNLKTRINRLIAGFALLTFCASFLPNPKADLHKKLEKYCSTLSIEFNLIDEERKTDLKWLGDFIIQQRAAHKPANLLFVCTSNSRRSHMGQIWAQTAAMYYGIDSLWTFSGGTEATRVNKNAVAAIERCGFGVYSNQQADNPLWYITVGSDTKPWAVFSKKYTDATNPIRNFAAVMVCTEADKACPIVEGADYRVGLPYEDPKTFDGTPSQDAKYDERCRQIAREMFFLMDYVQQKKAKS